MARQPFGEGPEFRVAWKELDFRGRRRVRKAVRRAEPLDVPREAALAAGLARKRQRRSYRTLAFLPVAVLVASVAAGVALRPEIALVEAARQTVLDPTTWAIPAIFGVLFPPVWLRRHRRLRRAEDLNRDVVLSMPAEKQEILSMPAEKQEMVDGGLDF